MTELNSENRSKKDLSVSLPAANIYSLFTGLLPALFFVFLFVLVWGGPVIAEGIVAFNRGVLPFVQFLLIMIVGIVIHEGLHALGWMTFGSQPREAIEFGIKQMTPYAHCKATMPLSAYRWGTLLPGLVLGILPSLLAVVTGSTFLLAVGFLFTFAAGGDFLILWLLRGVPSGTLVEDHPERAGCYVYLE